MSRRDSSRYVIPPGARPPIVPGSPVDRPLYSSPWSVQDNGNYASAIPQYSSASYTTQPALAMPEPFFTQSPQAPSPQFHQLSPTKSNTRRPSQSTQAQHPEAWRFPESHIGRSISHQSSLKLPSQSRPRSHSSLGMHPSPQQLDVPRSGPRLNHKYSYSDDIRGPDRPNLLQTHQRSPSVASTNISEDFAAISLQNPPADGMASADGLDRFQRGEGDDNEWAWHLLLTKEARESLPEQEVLRQSAMFELINGERSYVKDLQLVRDIFISGLRQARQPILSPGKVEIFIREVFYNVEHVLSHHERMLAALYDLQREQHPILLHIGHIILDNILKFQQEYDAYIKHYPVAESVHRRELKLNARYRMFLDKCSQDPRLGKRDVMTFISRPVTRLPRLNLQLDEILKRTEKLAQKEGNSVNEKNRYKEDYPDLETIPVVVEILNRFVKSTQPGIAASEGKVKFYALCESLKFRRGEIIDMDLYSEHRTLVHSGTLSRKERKGNWHVWGDYEVALLDNYFLMTKLDPETGSKEVKSRPIPLEFLRLGPFHGPKESRSERPGFINAISKSSRHMYPFVIYHVFSESRTYTLYASSEESRQQWKAALEDALGVKRAVMDTNKWFAMNSIDATFFRSKPALSTSNDASFPGRITAAVTFSQNGKNFVGVCTPTGIYFGLKGRSDYRRIFQQPTVKHIAVLQPFNKLIVLMNDTIWAYSLDVLSRIILGQTDRHALDVTAEKLAKADRSGSILFFRVGVVAGRTLVVYANKGFLNTTLFTLEAVLDQPNNILQRISSRSGAGDVTPTFRKYGEPFYVPREPVDVTLLAKTIAICTDRHMTVVDPTKLATQEPVYIPDFSALTGPGQPNPPLEALKERTDAARPIGIVRSGAEELIVIYDEFGCYVTKRAVPTRKCGYIRWETRVTSYAERGDHILLFSPRFIEVRHAGTGRLVQVLEGEDIRIIQSQAGSPLMVAMRGKATDKRGIVDELVELLETAPLETPRSSQGQGDIISSDQLWEEWE